MKLTHCKKCHTPIIRWDEYGLTQHADLTALTPTQIGHAWLNNQTTYKIHTLHNTQWANHHRDTPHNRQQLIHTLQTNQPQTATVLVQHTCTHHVTDPDHALHTWQPRDREAIKPTPKPIAILEGMPF